MTPAIRLPTLASALPALACLALLATTACNEAVAQGIQIYGNNQAYYNGYSAGYHSRFGNGSGPYGYGSYGSNRYGYTGYGTGPYGYRSPAPYGYSTSSGYGYSSGTYNSLYYRALRLRGGTYGPIYTPGTARYYSPYGNGTY